jgi:hypothetical protein
LYLYNRIARADEIVEALLYSQHKCLTIISAQWLVIELEGPYVTKKWILMNNHTCSNNISCVFGSFDPVGRSQDEVNDWAVSRGALLQIQVGALQLFTIGDIPTSIQIFSKDGIHGIFVGEIYEMASPLRELHGPGGEGKK